MQRNLQRPIAGASCPLEYRGGDERPSPILAIVTLLLGLVALVAASLFLATHAPGVFAHECAAHGGSLVHPAAGGVSCVSQDGTILARVS